MAINTQKFLPSSKGGALAKVAKISKGSVAVISEKSQQNIGIIKVKVIEIDKLLKGTVASQKKALDIKRKEGEKKKFSELETKLETKPKAEKGKIEMPKLPRMGFLDWIKNFIGNIILGYFAVRLVDQLPKLKGVISFIGAASDFVLDIGGKLLDGLVTFIDWGYKAYDATRGFMKNLFGEGGVKQFDELSGLLNKFLNLAIIAGMLSANSNGSGGGRNRGRNGTPRPKPGERFRPKVTESGGRRAGSGFDVRNPLRERPTITEGRGGRSGFRLPEFFGGKPRAKITGGGGGANRLLLSEVRPFLKRIPLPIIGTLVDFGLSVALGESPGRAAFRAIGAGLLGAVGAAAGTVVPVAGNFIGGLLGGMAGDAIGGALYDMFFGGKTPTQKGKTTKSAGGGKTKGQKTRTLKKGKYKRKLAPRKPGQIEMQPGADVGGEDKIFGLFPNPLKAAQNAIDMMNPFKVIENTGKELGKSDYFGPILAITSKILLGQKPTQKDYENVGLGINLLVSKGLNEGKLKGGLAAAFAEGGFVDPKTLDAISQSDDISDWVAKSFKESTENNAQKTLREIQDNLRLKGPEAEKQSKGDTGFGEDGDGGDVDLGPGGNADELAARVAKRMMKDFGLTEFQAAGAVGNLLAEGMGQGTGDVIQGGKRGAPRYNAPKSAGYSWAQWTNTEGGGPNDRLNRALIYLGMKDNPRPWSNEDAYKILKWELTTKGYGSVITKLKNSTSIDEAAMIWLTKYEGINDGTGPKRIGNAKRILPMIAKVQDTNINVGDIGDGTTGAPGSKASKIIAGAKKILGMYRGVSNACALSTRAALKAGGLTALANKISNGDLDTPKGYVKSAAGAGGLAGSDMGKVIREKSKIKAGDIIFWKGGGGYVGGDNAVTHVGIAADDGLQHQYDHSEQKGFIYRPFWTGYAGRNWFAGIRPYSEGGATLNKPHLAILGEEGEEIVIKHDKSIMVKDMLLAINQAKDPKGVMKAIQQYAPYDAMSPQTIVMPLSGSESDYDSEMSGGGVMVMGGDEGDSYDPFDALEMGG